MNSEFPASSSQQPFATPQPAPVPAASQATSPPTKASLKSWWKGFRPPTKSHDTPGKLPSHRKHIQRKYFQTDTFVSRVPKNRGPLFQENPMDGSVSIIDGLPLEEVVSRASPINQPSRANRRVSFQGFRHRYNSVRRSSSFLEGPKKSPRLHRPGVQRHVSEASPSSVRYTLQRSPAPQTPPTPIPQGNRFGQSRTFTADNSSESTLLDAGIIPSPKIRPFSHFFNSLTFSRLGSSSSEESAKESLKAAEQPTGIFGVPLRQSITYANVAISLVDAEGKSYIYGYVPIVVAKCGVYLKEKGRFGLDVSAGCQANNW